MLLATDAHTGGQGMALVVHSVVGVALTAVGSLGAYSVAPLFADTASGGELAAIVAISGLVGAAGKWAADQLVKWKKDRSDESDRDRQRRSEEKTTEITHLEALLNRETEERRQLQKEIADERRAHQAEINEARRQHQNELAEIRQELARASAKANRFEAWIRAQEMLMRIKGVEFAPLDPDDETVRPAGDAE
jgi:hypothetical protein